MFGIDETQQDNLDDTSIGRDGVGMAMRLAKALTSSGLLGLSTECRLYMVTRNAESCGSSGSVEPSQAPTIGFLAALNAEHPELSGTSIDIDPNNVVSASLPKLLISNLQTACVSRITSCTPWLQAHRPSYQ